MCLRHIHNANVLALFVFSSGETGQSLDFNYPVWLKISKLGQSQ